MDSKEKIRRINEQTNCPVFTVRHGVVANVNMAAMQLNIKVNTDIKTLIYSGLKDYLRYRGGTLYITVCLNEKIYNATVVRHSITDTFILDSEFVEPAYNQMHQISDKLRSPLTEALLCLSKLSSILECRNNEYMMLLKKNIYQMHRTLCNMTALPDLKVGSPKLLPNQNITEIVATLLRKTKAIIKPAGYKLKCTLPTRFVFCSLDPEALKHAIMNMLSNAMKYNNSSKVIHVKLAKVEDYCNISVISSFKDPSDMDKFDQFSILAHDPQCKNNADGIGLGLGVIRAAATIHNGSVLMERSSATTMRITLSIPVHLHAQNRRSTTLHTYRHLPVNYTGGYNIVLTELAELLPPESYK